MTTVAVMLLLSPRSAPAFAMLTDPIEQCALEPDIVAESFGLEPLVFQDLFPFGEEFLIQTGLFYELPRRRRLLSWLSHATREEMRATRLRLSMPAMFPKRQTRCGVGCFSRASNVSAISRNTFAASLCGEETTIGVPLSPPARISGMSGT
jgi:hypothetical protein